MTFLAACLGSPRQTPTSLCTAILTAQHAPSQHSLWGTDEVGLGAAVLPALAGGDRIAIGETIDDRWVLAFDGRLDDRPALTARLGIRRDSGTGTLLLAAWQRWGADTPEHLCGDYAVIAWDRAERSFVLARDPFGERPLFFRADGLGYACASMPAGLAAPFGVTLRPDLDRVTARLNHHLGTGGATWYAGIERVEPGECVILRAGQAPRRRRYWRPDTTPLHGRSSGEWGEALRAALLQAAADRLPADRRVASQLSAGLDSAGVTAAAAHVGADVVAMTAVPTPGAPLTVPPGRLADEGPLAAATAAHLDIAHLPLSSQASYADLLDDAFLSLAQPIPNGFNHPWSEAMFAEAARRGIGVLMCGQSGNFTFSVAGRPPRAPLRAAIRALVPDALVARFRRPKTNAADWTLAARVLPPEPPRSPAEHQLATLRAIDPGALMRSIHQRWGVALSDVTADRRLAELALRIPDAARIDGGLNRAPARAALAGLVPDAVRLSTHRGYQAADWLHVMTARLRAIRAETAALAVSPTARALIDLPRLQQIVDAWPRGLAYDPDVERLYRHVVPQTIVIAGWARRAAGET